MSYVISSADDVFDRRHEPRSWDQTHSLKAGLNWSDGHWNISTTATLNTGWPKTELVSDTITNPDEISDRFRIPILGVAPLTKTDEYPVEQTFISDPRSPLSEAIRSTKMSIQLAGTADQAKSFLLTSIKPSEGKTTMAANLALAFAGTGEQQRTGL